VAAYLAERIFKPAAVASFGVLDLIHHPPRRIRPNSSGPTVLHKTL